MKRALFILAGVLALAAPMRAATVLYSPLDSLDGWSVRTVGATRATVVDKADKTPCVEVTSSRGSVFLSRELPLAEVIDGRLTITCSVKGDRIVRGPQASSTGKIHLAVLTPRGIEHHYARFSGNSDWHQEAFTADIPADAKRILLNLGLESCFGTVRFSRLIVSSDKRGLHRLDLAAVANASHEQLKLPAFPEGEVTWKDVTFQVMDPAKHDGRDCLRLKSIEHPDWPAGTSAPIPVGKGATSIYILHGALSGREMSESPCAIWSATFVGGHTSSFSVFEGREIGAIGRAKDLENWQVAWRQKTEDGTSVTFGVTRWTVYSTMPLVSLSCRAYRGAAPVVLGVTVVEDPPEPEPEGGEFDDMGNMSG